MFNNTKTKYLIYWISTGMLCFGMLAGGLGQLFRADYNIEGMRHLGYPIYLLTLIGTCKMIGVFALLFPGNLRVKEWAYAGFFFLLIGATYSHLMAGDGILRSLPPLVFACLTLISWAMRPQWRKLQS